MSAKKKFGNVCEITLKFKKENVINPKLSESLKSEMQKPNLGPLKRETDPDVESLSTYTYSHAYKLETRAMEMEIEIELHRESNST